MSRTDKDRPYWVRAQDLLEPAGVRHRCGGQTTRSALRQRPVESLMCDIDVQVFTEDEWLTKTCHRYPVAVQWYDGSPRWWTQAHVHRPRRRKDRDALKDAARWYRTDSEGFTEDFDLGYDEPYEPWYW